MLSLIHISRRSLYDFREEMPEDVKMQVTALNEALTDVAVATPEEVQALYTRYLAIPAAERSYVFAAGALLDRMQELSLEITPEDVYKRQVLSRPVRQQRASDCGGPQEGDGQRVHPGSRA